MHNSSQGDHFRKKKPTIILIDDDGKFLEILSDSVERAGFSCDAVSDSRVAVDKIASEHFDIVVTDMSMPGLSGLDIIDRVREKSPQTFIIVVTGNNESNVEKNAFAHGADVFLRKPLNLVAFMETIRSHNSLPENDM